MITLRLIRTGKKNQPSFRLVAQDKNSPPKGKYKEDLGVWTPIVKTRTVNKARVAYWLSCGARPTDTVWNILVAEGIIKGKKRPVHGRSKKIPAQATHAPVETQAT